MSRASDIKDRLVNVGAALIVIVGLSGVAYGITEAHTNAQLTAKSITVSNRHHNASAAQQAQIISLGKQNKTLNEENNKLLTEHSADIANESQLLMGIKAADGELAAFAAWIVSVNMDICGGLHLSCPPPPSIAVLPAS